MAHHVNSDKCLERSLSEHCGHWSARALNGLVANDPRRTLHVMLEQLGPAEIAGIEADSDDKGSR
jgi:hypothetical protein